MSIITISRGSYSKGKEIAEKLARKLGYECLSRDVLIEASEHFNIPEVKLIRALHDSPSILERFIHGKEKYIAFIREAFLEHIKRGDVVYHGLAGHFFVREIPHILKVRIIANIEDRVKEEMNREGISEERAHYILKKDDEERRKWSLSLYGIDTSDPGLYDIVLHIVNLKVDDAVDILFDVSKRPCFQATPGSQKMLEDLLLSSKAHSALINNFPTAKVTCKAGLVHVSIHAPILHEENVITQVNTLLKDIEGIKGIETHIFPIFPQE
jgi:cytidylate kinase